MSVHPEARRGCVALTESEASLLSAFAAGAESQFDEKTQKLLMEKIRNKYGITGSRTYGVTHAVFIAIARKELDPLSCGIDPQRIEKIKNLSEEQLEVLKVMTGSEGSLCEQGDLQDYFDEKPGFLSVSIKKILQRINSTLGITGAGLAEGQTQAGAAYLAFQKMVLNKS